MLATTPNGSTELNSCDTNNTVNGRNTIAKRYNYNTNKHREHFKITCQKIQNKLKSQPQSFVRHVASA